MTNKTRILKKYTKQKFKNPRKPILRKPAKKTQNEQDRNKTLKRYGNFF